MKAQRFGRLIFYSLWAVLMTALTYMLGAVSLKVLRRQLGRSGFWFLGLTISAAFYFTPVKHLGVAFLSLVLLIGVFSELEEFGFSFMVSAFFTLLINCLLVAGAFALWVSRVGPKWPQLVTGYLESAFKPVAELNPTLTINFADLMVQLPSVIVVLWMGSIYLAVLLERRLMGSDAAIFLEPVEAHMTTGAHPHVPLREQLSEIRMPDPVVWIFIASLLGAFGGLELRWLEVLSANTLNICFVLFFFQGVAVVTKFFESLKMGFFWQFVFMALIIVHLFLFVSLVGLVDYWLDLRTRMNKRPTEFKRET